MSNLKIQGSWPLPRTLMEVGFTLLGISLSNLFACDALPSLSYRV